MFLPGKSHGQRILAGYSTRGLKKVGHNLATNQQCKYMEHFICMYSKHLIKGPLSIWYSGECWVHLAFSSLLLLSTSSRCTGSVAMIPGPLSADSVVVVSRLSYSLACGTFLDQESNSSVGRRILYHWAAREVLTYVSYFVFTVWRKSWFTVTGWFKWLPFLSFVSCSFHALQLFHRWWGSSDLKWPQNWVNLVA